jgi:transposase
MISSSAPGTGGAGGKIPVFGLLKRGGRVYTKIIPDSSSAILIQLSNVK